MTRTSLRAKGLLARWDVDPAGTILALHEIVVDGRGGRRDVFALAELSLIHAERKKSRPYFFGAAVYSWAFLFPEGADRSPSRFDDRTRVATELYNRAVVGAFRVKNGENLDLSSGLYSLPFGEIEVRMKPDELMWDGRRLIDLTLGDGRRLAAAEFVFAAGPWLPGLFPDVVGDLIRVTKPDVLFVGSPAGDARFSAGSLPCWLDSDGAV